MSNTTTWKNKTVQITGLDADWYPSNDMGITSNWLCVKSIQFHPSAANDILRITDGSLSGADIVHVKCDGDTDDKIVYFGNGQWMQPYLDESDCTFGTAASAKVIIHLA